MKDCLLQWFYHSLWVVGIQSLKWLQQQLIFLIIYIKWVKDEMSHFGVHIK